MVNTRLACATGPVWTLPMFQSSATTARSYRLTVY